MLRQGASPASAPPILAAPIAMSPSPREFFASHGYLHLQGFHPKARLAALRQAIAEEVKRSLLRAGTSKALRKLPVFQQIGRLSTLVRVPGVHGMLVTPTLLDLVTELGGRPPSTVQPAQLLLSPSHQGAWTLDGLNWHVDITADPPGLVPGVQAFFLIDDVEPRGGATLALVGSSLGADRSRLLASLRQALAGQTDWERQLQGLGVRLLEMSGRAGDVFLMDMRVLHTPSINSSAKVRMMGTCRCLFGPPP
jgi:hypothetical protein